MVTKVKELTLEQLSEIIDEVVDRKLVEFFGDPDEGLEPRKDLIRKLNQSRKRVRGGERGIPLEEVARKHGIKLKE